MCFFNDNLKTSASHSLFSPYIIGNNILYLKIQPYVPSFFFTFLTQLGTDFRCWILWRSQQASCLSCLNFQIFHFCLLSTSPLKCRQCWKFWDQSILPCWFPWELQLFRLYDKAMVAWEDRLFIFLSGPTELPSSHWVSNSVVGDLHLLPIAISQSKV